MDRNILQVEKVDPAALKAITSFHEDIVSEVKGAIEKNPVVIVGMAHNPFVKKVRKEFTAYGLSFQYLEYGSYFSQWKQRLAIKLWSGWPTYPQVFIDGVLIGGCAEALAMLKKGGASRQA